MSDIELKLPLDLPKDYPEYLAPSQETRRAKAMEVVAVAMGRISVSSPDAPNSALMTASQVYLYRPGRNLPREIGNVFYTSGFVLMDLLDRSLPEGSLAGDLLHESNPLGYIVNEGQYPQVAMALAKRGRELYKHDPAFLVTAQGLFDTFHRETPELNQGLIQEAVFDGLGFVAGMYRSAEEAANEMTESAPDMYAAEADLVALISGGSNQT